MDQGRRDAGAPPGPVIPPVMPPVVRILSPRMGEAVSGSPVEVRYSVRSPSGERVTAVDVFVDGRRLPDLGSAKGLDAGPATRDAEHEASVAVPIANHATISLVARSGDRVSEAAIVNLIWKGIAEADSGKPRLYVLAVGVSRYQDPRLVLDFARSTRAMWRR
jgi:hypothetical protein